MLQMATLQGNNIVVLKKVNAIIYSGIFLLCLLMIFEFGEN